MGNNYLSTISSRIEVRKMVLVIMPETFLLGFRHSIQAEIFRVKYLYGLFKLGFELS